MDKVGGACSSPAGNFEKRAEKLGITDMSVSISHEDGMSIAVVVMEAKS